MRLTVIIDQHDVIDIDRTMQLTARRMLRNERPDHTLQPTALVHEAYLRLIGQRNDDWQGRAHFIAIATTRVSRKPSVSDRSLAKWK